MQFVEVVIAYRYKRTWDKETRDDRKRALNKKSSRRKKKRRAELKELQKLLQEGPELVEQEKLEPLVVLVEQTLSRSQKQRRRKALKKAMNDSSLGDGGCLL